MKYDNSFVANLLLRSTVKEYQKSAIMHVVLLVAFTSLLCYYYYYYYYYVACCCRVCVRYRAVLTIPESWSLQALWKTPLRNSSPMIAKMMIINSTKRAICNSGAIAFRIDLSTTCRPTTNSHIIAYLGGHQRLSCLWVMGYGYYGKV